MYALHLGANGFSAWADAQIRRQTTRGPPSPSSVQTCVDVCRPPQISELLPYPTSIEPSQATQSVAGDANRAVFDVHTFLILSSCRPTAKARASKLCRLESATDDILPPTTQPGAQSGFGIGAPATIAMSGTKTCMFSGQRPHWYRSGVRSSDGFAARYRRETGSSPIIPKHEQA